LGSSGTRGGGDGSVKWDIFSERYHLFTVERLFKLSRVKFATRAEVQSNQVNREDERENYKLREVRFFWAL